MFKEIRATFKVVEDTAFIQGKWSKNREHFIFEVKRYLSGASAYGDRSAHSVEIANEPSIAGQYFDTRYNGISTVKEKWVSAWAQFIELEYGLKVELETYEEKEIEVEE